MTEFSGRRESGTYARFVESTKENKQLLNRAERRIVKQQLEKEPEDD